MIVANLIAGRDARVINVTPSAGIAEVVSILCEHRIGAVLVMDGDTIHGVLSERDIIRCLRDRGAEALDARANDLMTADVITVSPDESVTDAMGHMTHRRIRHLPVLDGGRLVGIVSIGDLVKARIEEAEAEAESLKDYIQHA